MTASDLPQTPAGKACSGLMVAAIGVGLLGWAWLGPWQWLATGAVALLVIGWVSTLVDSPQARNRRAAAWCTQCGRVREDLAEQQRRAS